MYLTLERPKPHAEAVLKLRYDVLKLGYDVLKLGYDVQKLRHDVQRLRYDVQKLRYDVQKLRYDVQKLRYDVQKLRYDVQKLRHDRSRCRKGRLLGYGNEIRRLAVRTNGNRAELSPKRKDDRDRQQPPRNTHERDHLLHDPTADLRHGTAGTLPADDHRVLARIHRSRDRRQLQGAREFGGRRCRDRVPRPDDEAKRDRGGPHIGLDTKTGGVTPPWVSLGTAIQAMHSLHGQLLEWMRQSMP